MSEDPIWCKVSSTKRLLLESLSPGPLPEPLCAVNWFDARPRWLYNLYNVLAFPFVRQVGGSAVFKGQVKRQIHGPSKLKRNSLLIVRYDSGHAFRAMIENGGFKAVSLLRVLSAKRFSFGLTSTGQLLERGWRPPPGHFIVQHYRHGEAEPYASRIAALAESMGAELVLHLRGAARLRLESRGEMREAIPYPFSGTLLISASSEASLNAFVESSAYRGLLKEDPEGVVAYVRRVI